MSYRYKQDFGRCFQELPLPKNEGPISHPLIELDEVYRKAEAWDELKGRLTTLVINSNNRLEYTGILDAMDAIYKEIEEADQ